MAAILLVGLVGYTQLPVSALPEVDYPTIQVLTFYPGASPTVMATTVTAPLERQFGELQGLSQMTSTSSGGTSVIVLQFNLSLAIDVAEEEVQSAINASQSLLPSILPAPPTYSKTNPADAPVLTLAITSNSMPLSQVEDLVDTRLAPKSISSVYPAAGGDLFADGRNPPGRPCRLYATACLRAAGSRLSHHSGAHVLSRASPTVMATTVTAPLERQFGELQGLSQMTSTSSGGTSVIVLQFNLTLAIDVAEEEVQSAINAVAESVARPSCPRRRPTARPIRPMPPCSRWPSPRIPCRFPRSRTWWTRALRPRFRSSTGSVLSPSAAAKSPPCAFKPTPRRCHPTASTWKTCARR